MAKKAIVTPSATIVEVDPATLAKETATKIAESYAASGATGQGLVRANVLALIPAGSVALTCYAEMLHATFKELGTLTVQAVRTLSAQVKRIAAGIADAAVAAEITKALESGKKLQDAIQESKCPTVKGSGRPRDEGKGADKKLSPREQVVAAFDQLPDEVKLETLADIWEHSVKLVKTPQVRVAAQAAIEALKKAA